jgi:ABC-type transport system substrate-binding protein
MKLKALISCLTLIPILSLVSSCSSGADKNGGKGKSLQSKNPEQVVVWELSDPEMLNPLITTEANADNIMWSMFQALEQIDFKTLDIVPVLAESRPIIEKTAKGGMSLTYQIRKEARWANGSPVTAKDVEFTIKATFNPALNNPAIKETMNFISDFKLYPEDPKKLTFICDSLYFLVETGCGGFQIMPEYFYDPNGWMKNYKVQDLIRNGQAFKNDSNIIKFANDMSSEKRLREGKSISGSGPYNLESWTPNKQLVLKKKPTYWGDSLAETIPYLGAYPLKLIYRTINDQISAVEALKAGDLDVIYSVLPKAFVELKKNPGITEKFNVYTPELLSYYFIGMNCKSKLLRSVKTRLALTYLCDVDKIIETVYYGLAKRITGPILSSDKKDYNSDLMPYPFDPQKARTLLSEDGWKDTNGDGILDKVIDGEKTEFKISFTINSGSATRKAMGLIFMEEARKAGIKVNLVEQELNTYLSNLKKHQVEMFISAWIASPVGNDLTQIWKSDAAVPGGNNFANFTNPQCDSLLDAIRIELDDNKRAVLNKRFQVLIHEQVPFIFMYTPTERLAISKKFTNAEPSVMRPGFCPSLFKLAGKD